MPSTDAIDQNEFDLLLTASARYALGPVDGEGFIRWFANIVPLLCPGFAAKFKGTEAEQRSAFMSLGRMLWNRLPQPDNHFRPLPLPKPERNAPCPCGSSYKYKQCCAPLEEVDNPFGGVSLLLYVLGQFPRTQLKSLPMAGLDVEELAHIGSEWRTNGRAADAEVLLERVFTDLDRLDGRAQWAFDVLADCYDDLYRPKKKKQLIERVSEARDPTLRSAALHRRITILADRGERAEAWRLFAQAQRHEPDNPLLATLEITMLLGEKKYDRVRERGQFWIARLARDRKHDFSDLIGHLRELIADPVDASLRHESTHRPGLLDLRRQLVGLPAIACHYRIEGDDGHASLVPSPALNALVTEWQRHSTAIKPDLTRLHADFEDPWERVAPGIAWIDRNPLAWQCFDILDDLALAVRDADLMTGAEALLAPLLERAEALLRSILEQHGANDRAFPWVFLENRPALRLIAGRFFLCQELQQAYTAFALVRWLVTTLNPDDNHGLRQELVRLMLERGDAQGALDVCDRYPDDRLVGLQFGRALALFLLQRQVEAQAALRIAKVNAPLVLPMLLAANPKPVRTVGPYLRMGGKEEAWNHRRAFHALWEASGALEWARGAAGQRGRRPRS
ncbi:MAG: SEC-C metal-binding domain-containing protein [Casimicrobiaceae bacterium]